MAEKAGAAMAPTGAARLSVMRDPFRHFQQRFNRFFEEAFAGEPWSLAAWAPACDILETENEIIVKAELPEVKREDVRVTLQNNLLTIRGERKLEEKTEREDYRRIERSYGEFFRSFALPAFVDPNKITAEFKDGVLRVILAKREEVKPKQVEVNVK